MRATSETWKLHSTIFSPKTSGRPTAYGSNVNPTTTDTMAMRFFRASRSSIHIIRMSPTCVSSGAAFCIVQSRFRVCRKQFTVFVFTFRCSLTRGVGKWLRWPTNPADIADPDAPLIIAGDFNDWRNEADDLLATRLGLNEVFGGAGGSFGSPGAAFRPNCLS